MCLPGTCALQWREVAAGTPLWGEADAGGLLFAGPMMAPGGKVVEFGDDVYGAG
jgi:hypothetical protein